MAEIIVGIGFTAATAGVPTAKRRLEYLSYLSAGCLAQGLPYAPSDLDYYKGPRYSDLCLVHQITLSSSVPNLTSKTI